MEKNIRDYLHLYLGCEVEYSGIINGKELKEENQRLKESGNPFQMSAIKEKIDVKYGFLREIHCTNNGTIYKIRVGRKGLKSYWVMEGFKLLLRPLSDITEEEMLGAGKYQYPNVPGFKCEFVSKNILIRPEVTRYMVNQGFDLFGLIESGLAIDKTKLPSHDPHHSRR